MFVITGNEPDISAFDYGCVDRKEAYGNHYFLFLSKIIITSFPECGNTCKNEQLWKKDFFSEKYILRKSTVVINSSRSWAKAIDVLFVFIV